MEGEERGRGTLGCSNVSCGRKMSTLGRVSYKSQQGSQERIESGPQARHGLPEGPAGTKRPLPTMLSLQWPNTASAQQSRLHRRLKENKAVPWPLNQMMKHNCQETLFFSLRPVDRFFMRQRTSKTKPYETLWTQASPRVTEDQDP